MNKTRNPYKRSLENLDGKDHLRNRSWVCEIFLKCILKRRDIEVYICLNTSAELDNECRYDTLVSVRRKGTEFVHHVNIYRLPKNTLNLESNQDGCPSVFFHTAPVSRDAGHCNPILIWEVPGSNLDPETVYTVWDFRYFPQSLKEIFTTVT